MSTVTSSLPGSTSIPGYTPEFKEISKPENLIAAKRPGPLHKTQHHHPPISYSYGSVCLLCYRTKTCTTVKSDFEKHRESRRNCTKYIVLLSRYLKLDTELTKISQKRYFQSAGPEDDYEAFFKEEVNKFVVCDLCLPLAESFCKTYQEFEVLRMKLEAKILESAACVEKSEVVAESLRVICGVRKGAGGAKTSDPTEDVLQNFRKELKTQGSNLIKRKGPKLQLERDKKIDQLVPCKVSKLSKDSSSATSTKASNSNDPTVNSDNKISSKPSTAFKIVRKPVGGHAAAPTQINIVRLPQEPSPENNNNNNSDKEDSSDIKVISIVQRTPPQQSLVRPPPGPAATVPASTPVPTRIIYQNPNLQPIQNSIVPAAAPQLWSLPLQNTSLFQANLLPSSVNVTQVTRQDGALANVSSNMMPIHIVPIIKVQHCNINGCTVSFPKTEQGFKNMHIHLSTHKNMMCTRCPDILENPFVLISHELKHEMDNPKRMQGFQCPRCPYLSLTRVEFQEHFLERHLYAKVELLKCSVCKRGYNHQKDQQYWSHLQNCHPDPISEDVAQLPSCMICRASFRKKVNLWKHLKNDHRINSQGGSFQCANCSDSFFFQNLLELHQEFACEGRQKQGCPYHGCSSTFTKTISLKRHLERVHPDFQLPECPVCKLQFFDIETLRYHVLTHNGEQVKILFSEGNGQDAQVIPVEATNTMSLMDVMNTPPPTPVYNQIQYQGQTIQTVVSSIVLSANAVGPPVPSPSPAPVIVSVSGASQLPISSPMVVPSNYSNDLFPSNQFHCSNVEQAEMDIKMLEKFFDESNDSEEHLMEFFENVIPLEGGGAGDNMAPQDEDPFAWMLAEDFQIN